MRSGRVWMLLALLFALCVCSAPQSAVAGLIWDTVHREAEADDATGHVTVRYRCVNNGQRPVAIAGIYRSCGCTSVKASPELVPIGGTATVTARIDVAKQVGARTVELSVNTDDRMVHHLTAQILAPAVGHFLPSRLNWESGASRAPKTIRFVPLPQQKLIFDHLDYDGTVFSARVVGEPSHDGVTVSITPLPTEVARVGRVFVFCRVPGSRNVKMHVLRVSVGAGVLSQPSDDLAANDAAAHPKDDGAGVIHAEHETVSLPQLLIEEPSRAFQATAGDRLVSHQFVLKNTGDAGLTVSRSFTSSGRISGRVLTPQIPPGEQGLVEVRLRLAGQKGSQNQAFEILTNDPRVPRISLRLHGSINALSSGTN